MSIYLRTTYLIKIASINDIKVKVSRNIGISGRDKLIIIGAMLINSELLIKSKKHAKNTPKPTKS